MRDSGGTVHERQQAATTVHLSLGACSCGTSRLQHSAHAVAVWQLVVATAATCEAGCSSLAGMAQAMCAQPQAASLVAMIMLQGLCQLRVGCVAEAGRTGQGSVKDVVRVCREIA
jgi:hypothetical protein